MRVLIVDDERLARERLNTLLQQFPGCEVVGEAGDGKSAVERIQALTPDVVLLDVRMPGLDGLAVARSLKDMDIPPAVIFTTAHSEHALPAFDTVACGFLLKPIRREALHQALLKARRPTRTQLQAAQQSLAGESDSRAHIVATTRDGQVRIPVTDVIYFMADQKYTTVHHLHGEVLIEESLRHLEDDLAHQFVRVHRKALVNRDYVIGLERADNEGAYLTMRHSDIRLPVSRRRLPAIRRELFPHHPHDTSQEN